jgi:hypothetical protein
VQFIKRKRIQYKILLKYNENESTANNTEKSSWIWMDTRG